MRLTVRNLLLLNLFLLAVVTAEVAAHAKQPKKIPLKQVEKAPVGATVRSFGRVEDVKDYGDKWRLVVCDQNRRHCLVLWTEKCRGCVVPDRGDSVSFKGERTK